MDLASSAFNLQSECMTRTGNDMDDRTDAERKRRNGVGTGHDAVEFALRPAAVEPASLDEARQLRGSGWDGDLDEMRTGR